MRFVPFLALIACGPDLPEGWEDAEPIDDLTQSPCSSDNTPYTDTNERIEGSRSGDTVQIDYLEAHFRCEQDVEGFWRESAPGEVAILVQPIDMNPKVVAGCDCLYDISIGLDSQAGRFELFRRWDAINDPNDPVSIGTWTDGASKR